MAHILRHVCSFCGDRFRTIRERFQHAKDCKEGRSK